MAIQRILALGGEEIGSPSGDESGRHRFDDHQSPGGSNSHRRSGNGGTDGDGSDNGQNDPGTGGPGSGGSGDAEASGDSASVPICSAMRQSVTIPNLSAGSSGNVSPGSNSDPTLQKSHFTVHQIGDTSQEAVCPPTLYSPFVHNPAAAATAATGGTTIAECRTCQAVRSTRAASRSEAVVRVNGTAAQGIRTIRGTTTATREALTTTAKGTTAKGTLARGGAPGIARPAATSAHSGGIARGATTAQHAVSQTSVRSSDIVRGATTASRASVPNTPQGAPGGAGRPGAGSEAARSDVHALTARGTQTRGDASPSTRGGNSGRSGDVARGATTSRGDDSAGLVHTAGPVQGVGAARGGTGLVGTARGTGASAKNAATQRAGIAGARGTDSVRGSQAGPRVSTGIQGANSTYPVASGLKNGAFKQDVSPWPAGSVRKGGIVWWSALDAAPASATTGVAAGLTAGRRRNGEEEALQFPEGLSQAPDYGQGREVTFLKTGTRQRGETAAWQQDKAVPPKTGETTAQQQGQTALPQNKGIQHNGAGNFQAQGT